MKDLLHKLLEERARATGELQKFTQAAEGRADNGRLTAEDMQEFERRSADLDDLDGRIKMLKDRVIGDSQADEMRAGLEGLLRPDVHVDHEQESWAAQEQRTADFFRGKGGKSLEISFTGMHIERDARSGRRTVHETRSLRPLTESRTGLVDGTATAGGNLFGPSFRSVLYQHLIFNAAIMQTRATVLTTSSGENLLLPKTTAHPVTGTIVAENAGIGESDPTFGQGTLGAYKYGNLVEVSTELEQDTQVDLLGYLAQIMGRQIGNGFGKDCVTGTGTSAPQGVLVGAGTIAQVVGGTPATSGVTFSELEQVYDKIIPPYQREGEWFLGQSAFSKIRSLVNSQGTPIFIPTLYGDQPDTIFGKKVILDPNMPAPAVGATSIAFGDFSTYFIRQVDGVRFERSVDYAFNTDQVAYRALLRADGRLLDLTGAIAVYKGGTA